jgi:D-alanyl-D-alanine carboxypeptidase
LTSDGLVGVLGLAKPIFLMFALILSLIMLFSLNSVAHDTVQTRLDKFNENWTNVIAFKGETGKVLIQQHNWIRLVFASYRLRLHPMS